MKKNKLVPRLRFPEFRTNIDFFNGNLLFEQISNKNHNSDLPILAITQDRGAIPRNEIDYNITATEKSISTYKVVEVGDFIISGGELSALCLADSIARHIKDVLGNTDSLQGESFESQLLEAPNFTKSQQFNKEFTFLAPTSEYLNGNHAIIADLKTKMAKMKTQYFRPDLL